MNLTLHLVACDLRYLRHYLGLWLGLVVLQAVLVGYAPHLPLRQPQPDFVLSHLAWELPSLAWAGGSPQDLPAGGVGCPTGAQGPHHWKHRLLVQPTAVESPPAGRQVPLSARCRRPAHPPGGAGPPVRMWSHSLRHVSIGSADPLSDGAGAGCPHDAGGCDHQPGRNDPGGGPDTGRCAIAVDLLFDGGILVMAVGGRDPARRRRFRRRSPCRLQASAAIWCYVRVCCS